MNDRIILLRKTLKLSQTAFGEKLGVSRSVINNIERELTDLKPPLSRLICSIFNVNPNWLENGKGEMFLPDNASLSVLQKQYGLSDNAIKFLENFVHMDKVEQDEFVKILSNLTSD